MENKFDRKAGTTKKENKKDDSEQKFFRRDDSFYKNVFESLEDYALFTTDTEGLINTWNVGAERILGYTEQDIIGTHFAVIFTDEDKESQQAQKEIDPLCQKEKRWMSAIIYAKTDQHFGHRVCYSLCTMSTISSWDSPRFYVITPIRKKKRIF